MNAPWTCALADSCQASITPVQRQLPAMPLPTSRCGAPAAHPSRRAPIMEQFYPVCRQLVAEIWRLWVAFQSHLARMRMLRCWIAKTGNVNTFLDLFRTSTRGRPQPVAVPFTSDGRGNQARAVQKCTASQVLTWAACCQPDQVDSDSRTCATPCSFASHTIPAIVCEAHLLRRLPRCPMSPCTLDQAP